MIRCYIFALNMWNSSNVYGSIRLNLSGASMLSFELSAIDLILLIAVIVLLVLYITSLSARAPTEEKLSVADLCRGDFDACFISSGFSAG